MRSVALLISLGVILGGCGLDRPMTSHPRPFASEVWKTSGATGPRCDMVDDLLNRAGRNRGGLIGLTRPEMVALLGEPEDDGQGPDHYHLCPSAMDIWILELGYADGRVNSAIVRDT